MSGGSRMTRVGSVSAVALAAAAGAGCIAGAAPRADGSASSCASRFSWDGQRYVGRGPLRYVPQTAGTLGRGEIRGCPDQPVLPATVYAFAAVDPSVAVLVRTDDYPSEARLWTIPGTLVESARHPLHTALFADGEPDPARDHRCGSRRTLTVRVVFPTRQDFGPKVAPADGVTGKRFLRGRNVRGYLSIAARTRLVAANRNGVPFLGRGDLLRIWARRCGETARYRAEHHGSRNPIVLLDRVRVLKREQAALPDSHG